LPDTIFIDKIIHTSDTIIRMDTVIQTDTIIRYDTVTVIKEIQPERVKGKMKHVRSDVFNTDARRNKGWAFGLSYGKQLTDFKISALGNNQELVEKIDAAEHWSFRGNLFSMNAIYNYYRFKAGAAVDYRSIASKFNFKKVNTSGGLFNVDTLDAYYTLTGVDTNWVYIKDSTWIPLNRMEYVYSQINNLSYLDFHLTASYAIIHNQNLDFCLQAGMGLNYLLSASGNTITKTADFEVIDFEEMKFNKINYSFRMGIEARIKLTDAIDLNPELYYFGQMKDVYQYAMVHSKLHGLAVKIGLLYYL